MEFTAEQKLYGDIIQKVSEDANFKKALIENPLETLEEFSGRNLNIPDGKSLKVRFVDDSNKDEALDKSYVYFDIPDLENMELNEEQLEIVSGGSSYPCYAIGGAIVGLFMAGFRHGQADREE